MGVKYLLLDVDGTLTDGKVYLGNSKEEYKAFNIKDGYGIHDILIPKGIIPIIITGRSSFIVERRSRELGINYLFQGVGDKSKVLKNLSHQFNTSLDNFAYIGDDLNDLDCMLAIKAAGGIVGCPSDAVKEILSISDYICEHSGGNGAVREFIEYIIDNVF